jgi:PAT family beta-lactamase induction signal transducer AmpG
LFGISFGYYETIFFALSMQFTDSRIAASMFAILMAVANIGTGTSLGLTGSIAHHFGYKVAFLFLALMNLVAIPLLGLMRKKPAEMASAE